MVSTVATLTYNHLYMFRIDFPFTDAHLLLTPRLGGMSRYSQVGILVLILAILLFLISNSVCTNDSSRDSGL